MRVAALVFFLLLFWLVLSGHYTPWLIGAGVLSAIVLAAFARRMESIDDEGHPYEWLAGALTYWPWLAWEIVKSTIDVVRIILNPALPIAPRLIFVRPSQKTAVGAVTYANSITLTPGTITVEIDRHDRRFTVHALTEAGAAGLETGDMDRHVASFEGKR